MFLAFHYKASFEILTTFPVEVIYDDLLEISLEFIKVMNIIGTLYV